MMGTEHNGDPSKSLLLMCVAVAGQRTHYGASHGSLLRGPCRISLVTGNSSAEANDWMLAEGLVGADKHAHGKAVRQRMPCPIMLQL